MAVATKLKIFAAVDEDIVIITGFVFVVAGIAVADLATLKNVVETFAVVDVVVGDGVVVAVEDVADVVVAVVGLVVEYYL